MSRQAIVRLVLACVLLIPLAYSIPLIGLGLQDLNAVRHFDGGEFQIIDAWVSVYPHGPLYAGPFKIDHIYPKAFYNLAGLFLYPYNIMHGEDFRVDLMIWRGMNAILGAGAVLALFFLVRRVFQSDAAGVVAGGLFASTSEFLVWVANVRPNPLEQMLTFATLLLCVRLCERFSSRLFLLASLTGALAFATKYGGVLFLFLVPATAVYAAWRQGDRLPEIVQEQVRVLRLGLPIIGLVVIGALMMYGRVFYRYNFDGVALVTGLSAAAFPPERLGRVAARLESWRAMIEPATWGIFAGLAALAGAVAATWFWMRNFLASGVRHSGRRPYELLFVTFMIQTVFIYAATFFFTGPAYVAHPEHFVSQVGWMVYYSGFAGSYGDAPPGFVQAFQQAAADFPGWWAFVALVLFALYVQLRERTVRDQRLVLWSFIVVSLIVFIGTKVGAVRHILPAIGLLCGFVGYAIVRFFMNRLPGSLSKVAASTVLVVLLCGYVGVNLAVAVEQWENKWRKSEDVGFEVGNWLRSEYGQQTKILTDSWAFYVPPEFANVSTTRSAEADGTTMNEKQRSVRDYVAAFDPDVIIVTEQKHAVKQVRLDELLNSDPVLQARGYRMVRQFESHRRGDRFGNIRIYEHATDARRG